MGFDRFQQARREPEELNLIPIMNLFVVLIPFLLAGAAFLRIGVIPTSLPAHNPSESDVPKTPTTVACNLVVKPQELKLTVASVSLSPEELAALGSQWPNKNGAHDIEGLQTWLVQLKTRYPGSNTITVVPEDDIKYQDLVRVLDATRERPANRVNERGEEVFEELFPVTIFSRIVRGEDAVDPGDLEDGEESVDDQEAQPTE